MNKWILVGSVWMVAVTSAALLVHKLNAPPDPAHLTGATAPANDALGQAFDEPAVDTAKPSVLELPVVTIVGSLRGTAEMQGASSVTIGPGTVTHGE